MIAPSIDLESDPPVRGFLHTPASPNGNALVLTHGAGANCEARLLVEVSNAFAAEGLAVLRCDLPFRQTRPHGPPFPASAARDRDGLRRAVTAMKKNSKGRVYLGGHSYGGRQASILISEEPSVADALLLLSYPLHPPRKPAELRTSHFPKITKPAFFVHGTRDPFGTIEEMEAALKLIPAHHVLLEVDGAGHDLLGKKAASELPVRIASRFIAFLRECRA